MTPYELSIEEAKEFVIQRLGEATEVQELMFYIQKLEREVKQLREANSNYSWMVNPDRMGQ